MAFGRGVELELGGEVVERAPALHTKYLSLDHVELILTVFQGDCKALKNLAWCWWYGAS